MPRPQHEGKRPPTQQQASASIDVDESTSSQEEEDNDRQDGLENDEHRSGGGQRAEKRPRHSASTEELDFEYGYYPNGLDCLVEEQRLASSPMTIFRDCHMNMLEGPDDIPEVTTRFSLTNSKALRQELSTDAYFDQIRVPVLFDWGGIRILVANMFFAINQAGTLNSRSAKTYVGIEARKFAQLVEVNLTQSIRNSELIPAEGRRVGLIVRAITDCWGKPVVVCSDKDKLSLNKRSPIAKLSVFSKMLYVAFLDVDRYTTSIVLYCAYYVGLQAVMALSDSQGWSRRAAPLDVNPHDVLKNLRGVFRQFRVGKPAAKHLSLLSLFVVLWFGLDLNPARLSMVEWPREFDPRTCNFTSEGEFNIFVEAASILKSIRGQLVDRHIHQLQPVRAQQ